MNCGFPLDILQKFFGFKRFAHRSMPAAIMAMPNAANSAANIHPSGVRPAAANTPPPIKFTPFKTFPKI